MKIKYLFTKRNFTKMNNKHNDYIVVHYVGAVSSAYNNAKYFETVYRGASAHYFVDEKEIYQVVREGDTSWHCGSKYYKHLSCRNSNSIGVEMCCYINEYGKLDVSDKVIERTVELVKELMKKYNIPVENVLRHYDVCSKNCPAPFVEYPERWAYFLDKLKQATGEKYKQWDAVEVHIPIELTGAREGINVLVDTNGYQYWVHETVIQNNQIVARAIIAYADTDKCLVQIFDKQFWCDNKYIVKKLN